MAPRPPLFSRRQLNLIIFVTAAVIALLSVPTSPWPEFQRSVLRQVPLSYSTASAQPPELRLSFALPQQTLLPADAAELLQLLLEQRLAQTASAFKSNLHRDRLTLTITATSPALLALALPQLAPLLRQPFEPEALIQVIKQHRAQQHLDRNQPSPLQSADDWLQEQLPPSKNQKPNNLTDAAITQLQQQLFNRTQLRLSLTGSELEPITAALSAALEQFGPIQSDPEQPNEKQSDQEHPSPNNTRATTQRPSAIDLSPVAGLQPLAGRQSPLFPQAVLLSRLLEALTPEATLRLYSGSQTSWLVWLNPLQTSSHWLEEQITQIQQRLAAMKDWELERAGDDLLDQLEQRLEEPGVIAEQLEVIAFYQLPLDYLPQFEATIAGLTRAEIRQQLLGLLQPERFSYPPTLATRLNNAASKP